MTFLWMRVVATIIIGLNVLGHWFGIVAIGNRDSEFNLALDLVFVIVTIWLI